MSRHAHKMRTLQEVKDDVVELTKNIRLGQILVDQDKPFEQSGLHEK